MICSYVNFFINILRVKLIAKDFQIAFAKMRNLDLYHMNLIIKGIGKPENLQHALLVFDGNNGESCHIDLFWKRSR